MIGIHYYTIMKTFYVFSLQGFPTLFTDSNSPDNSFHAHYCHAYWKVLIGVQPWYITMLVSKQQCCFCSVYQAYTWTDSSVELIVIHFCFLQVSETK